MQFSARVARRLRVMLEALLASTVSMATPILLAALGELIVEQSGVLNVGIEGAMLAGAFFGIAAAYFTGSIALGLLAAIAAGVALNALFALLVVNLAVNQVVAGTALDILALGLTGVFYRRMFGVTGSAFVVRQLGPLALASLARRGRAARDGRRAGAWRLSTALGGAPGVGRADGAERRVSDPGLRGYVRRRDVGRPRFCRAGGGYSRALEGLGMRGGIGVVRCGDGIAVWLAGARHRGAVSGLPRATVCADAGGAGGLRRPGPGTKRARRALRASVGDSLAAARVKLSAAASVRSFHFLVRAGPRPVAGGVRRDSHRFHLAIETRPLVADPDHQCGDVYNSVRQQQRGQKQEYNRRRDRPSQRPRLHLYRLRRPVGRTFH